MRLPPLHLALHLAFQFVVILGLALPREVGAQTLTEPEANRIRYEAGDAFLAEDFTRLERWSRAYRQSKARTSDRSWKLAKLYAGIVRAMERVEPSELHWRMLEGKAQRWVATYPRSPSAVIVLGKALEGHAWLFRGQGFASNVSKKEFEAFRHYVELAFETLQTSRSFASVDPEWYASMIRIAHDQGWGRTEFQDLFNEAVKREPLYTPTYFASVDYLQPKWGGSVEEIDALVRRATELTQRTEGQSLYADIYWYAASDFSDIFKDTLVQWPKLKEGFTDLLKRHPDVNAQNAFTRFACAAQDRETAGELLRQGRQNISAAYWNSPEELLQCKRWVEKTP